MHQFQGCSLQVRTRNCAQAVRILGLFCIARIAGAESFLFAPVHAPMEPSHFNILALPHRTLISTVQRKVGTSQWAHAFPLWQVVAVVSKGASSSNVEGEERSSAETEDTLNTGVVLFHRCGANAEGDLGLSARFQFGIFGPTYHVLPPILACSFLEYPHKYRSMYSLYTHWIS